MTTTNVFSEEVPDLLQLYFNHLLGSPLSLDMIKERSYRSVLGRKDLKTLGFSRAQQLIPGILIPLWGPDGSSAGHQYRPDNPRLNSKGKPVKYENPTGSSVNLDVPTWCRPMIGDPKILLAQIKDLEKSDLSEFSNDFLSYIKEHYGAGVIEELSQSDADSLIAALEGRKNKALKDQASA